MQLAPGRVNTNTCPNPLPADTVVSRTSVVRSLFDALQSKSRIKSATVFDTDAAR